MSADIAGGDIRLDIRESTPKLRDQLDGDQRYREKVDR